MMYLNKELIQGFISKLDRSDNTRKSYQWALEYFHDAVGDAPLNVESYEALLISIKNLSPSTKRIIRAAVKRLYEYHDADDPKMLKLDRVYFRKRKNKSVNFDFDAVEKIINYCDGLRGNLLELRDRAFVLTLADSGLRISELAGLKRGDIDWKHERVVIEGKGEKIAVVRFSWRARRALYDYLEARAKMDGKTRMPLTQLPLFARHGRINTTKSMSIDGMRQSIVLRMAEAGARVRIHDFRHYFVTKILKKTGNLKKAQELARHESVATTQRYAHLADNELDTSYEAIFNK